MAVHLEFVVNANTTCGQSIAMLMGARRAQHSLSMRTMQLQSLILTLLCFIVQLLAMVWYSLSFIVSHSLPPSGPASHRILEHSWRLHIGTRLGMTVPLSSVSCLASVPVRWALRFFRTCLKYVFCVQPFAREMAWKMISRCFN